MNTIGIFEAETKFAQLCEQVYHTQEPVLITKKGVPFVRIEPITSYSQQPSTVWKSREAFIEHCGELSPEYELPARETSLQDKNPLDD
jgi:prevent-host-death family protein